MSVPNLEFTYPTEEVVPSWTLTNGVPADGYTTDALTNDNPADPYKVNSLYLRLVGDAGAPATVAVAAILHANFDPGLANILLQGGTSFASVASGGAPFSVAFPLPAYFPDQFPVNLLLDLRPLGPLPTYPYWSLVTGNGDGSSDANSVPISIGELKLYSAVHAIDGSLVVDLSPTEEETYPVIDHPTDGEVNLLYPIGTKHRMLRGGIIQETPAAEVVQEWWRTTKGRSSPFLVLVTDAEGIGPVGVEPWFVRFESTTLIRKFTYGTAASVFEFGLEELSRGLRPTPAAV